MVSDEPKLDELMKYRTGRPVLSVYLSSETPGAPPGQIKLHLKQLLEEFEQRAPDDVRVIRDYVEIHPSAAAMSLAAFSCAADGYFLAIPLSVPLRSRARLLDRPYVTPLADLLDSYGHTGVVLVDQRDSRFFHFHLGELQEAAHVEGKPVRRTKLGSASSFAGRRGGTADRSQKVRATAQRNLKDSAAYAVRFLASHRVRRVVVGGTQDNVARFLPLLPKAWQSLVRGTFPMDIDATQDRVLDKAMEVAAADERDREAQQVSAVITAAAKGKGGVVRLDDTLEEVHAGRMQTLVVADGYAAPGYRCPGCGFLTTQKLEACPFSGDRLEQIEDAVEMVVRRVLEDGGEVHIVHQNDELVRAGSIGGILRY